MKYLYYKLWQDFTGRVKNNTPALYSMFWLSFIQSVNVMTFIVFLNHFIYLKLDRLAKDDIIIYSSILGLLMMVLNYFYLFKKREAIYLKYKEEKKQFKIVGLILLYVYMIGTFILAYLVSQVFPVK